MTTSEWNGGEWRNKLTQLMARDFGGSEPAPESLMASLMRSGMSSVIDFGSDMGRMDILYAAMRLFWDSYELWKDRSEKDGSALPVEYDDLFLDWIDDLYRHFRVPYIPDGDDELDNYYELFTYLHIAAARAFRIRSGAELSEEVIDCLAEVERTMARLDGPHGPSTGFFTEAPSFHTSAGAISAMAFVELSRVRMSESRYVEALHYLSGAARYYDGAAANFHGEEINELWPENYQREYLWESRLQRLFTGLSVSALEMVNVFQAIKSHTRFVDDWKQLARDCEAISDSGIHTWDFAELRNRRDDGLVAVTTLDSNSRFDPIQDELIVLNAETEGDLRDVVTWREFWHGAKVWASAQLSPGEYRKMREEDERDAAERRLKNYFFERTWSSLPERAKQRLVNADMIWNSTERVSRESILNDLLRASEQMCEHLIFQPLMNDERLKPHILSIEGKVAEDSRRRSLGVREYIRICRLQCLPISLKELSLQEAEIEFLSRRLPTALECLTEARNAAEHENDRLVPSEPVNSNYRRFLGIGEPGVLPNLAHIAGKLLPNRSSPISRLRG